MDFWKTNNSNRVNGTVLLKLLYLYWLVTPMLKVYNYKVSIYLTTVYCYYFTYCHWRSYTCLMSCCICMDQVLVAVWTLAWEQDTVEVGSFVVTGSHSVIHSSNQIHIYPWMLYSLYRVKYCTSVNSRIYLHVCSYLTRRIFHVGRCILQVDQIVVARDEGDILEEVVRVCTDSTVHQLYTHRASHRMLPIYDMSCTLGRSHWWVHTLLLEEEEQVHRMCSCSGETCLPLDICSLCHSNLPST